MNISIDSKDILNVIGQLKLPPMLMVQGVTFQPGGHILIDGAIDLPAPLGGFDAKLALSLTVADGRTARLRITDAKTMGISLRDLAVEVIKRFDLPGMRVVSNDKDTYVEYSLPVDFITLGDVFTDNNELTLSVQSIDVAKLQAYQQAQAVKAASGSLAGQANLGAQGFHAQGTTTGTPVGAVSVHKPIGT